MPKLTIANSRVASLRTEMFDQPELSIPLASNFELTRNFADGRSVFFCRQFVRVLMALGLLLGALASDHVWGKESTVDDLLEQRQSIAAEYEAAEQTQDAAARQTPVEKWIEIDRRLLSSGKLDAR